MPYRIFLLAGLAPLASCNAPEPVDAGSPLSFNIDRVTVSGISSGAYMAGQLHVAHSSLVDGAALLAGGPYLCADGSIQKALGACVTGRDIALDVIESRVRRYAESGDIDDPRNLRDDPVWLFHGTADETVNRSVTAAAKELYGRYVAAEGMTFIDSVDAVHGMPTQTTGLPCDEFASPFINNCGFDAAGELLGHLHGPLRAPVPSQETGALLEVDQAAYERAELWDHAWLYAPEECKRGAACGLHVAFHGCLQSAEFVDDSFARLAGYNEWAEANRLVVLYPQVRSSNVAPLNPLGCWDWWGYTGEDYATKSGAQIAAVRSMLDALIDAGH